MITKIKKHWVVSLFITLIVVTFCYMFVTDTLSYPYILISRQIQMIKYCKHGPNEFITSEYRFSIKAPEKYCFLPNRLFPDDGSIHILPKGLYSSINEYATGSVILNSKSTLLFEPVRSDRNTKAVLDALKKGGFLVDAKISEKTNKNDINITIVENAKGIDETKHYKWAFLTHPNGKIFLSILLSNTEDSSVFDYVIENIKAE